MLTSLSLLHRETGVLGPLQCGVNLLTPWTEDEGGSRKPAGLAANLAEGDKPVKDSHRIALPPANARTQQPR